MALLGVLVLILSTIGGSDGSWCVCRTDVSDSALQKTIDYACGSGADCTAILQNGACYQPSTVRSHCNWAANSYYQKKVQTGATCDFSGTATLSNSDPSYSGCSFPSSASSSGTPTSTTPNSFTPTGVLGLGSPSSSISPDGSGAGLHIMAGKQALSMAVVLFGSALILLLRA